MCNSLKTFSFTDVQKQLTETERQRKVLEVDIANVRRELEAKGKVDTVKNKLVDMQV